MVDVAVSAQLQQWTFEKSSVVRPERSHSSASSPDLYNNENETLRIDTAVDDTKNQDTKEALFSERYLSSEEDLSPLASEDSDDEASIHDIEKQCFSARKMSISRFEKGKSCDLAVMVSYVSAGRPKMINLPNVGPPIQNKTQRSASASLAQLPIAAINKLRKAENASRLSLTPSSSSQSVSPRSTSPACNSRRPSTGHLPFSHNNSSLRISDSSSSFTDGSIRSSSPSKGDNSTRPTNATTTSHPQRQSSLYIAPDTNASPLVPFPPLTPQSPEPHSFLSSDPYENSTTSAASPIIKSGPHKRLRSISQKLSLAKIAITPSTKKWDSRINGKVGGTMPPTPATPYTPVTPMTAPPTTFSSPKNRRRRNSKIASRPVSRHVPSPEVPPVPTLSKPQSEKTLQKMVARGADERESPFELPPFPDDDDADPAMEIKTRRVRKRKSLMDLL
ncbi:hypothetical protein K469DRAFT_715931 [Zopfia rhizophila CBS 207.26]|uniref:Uncharacterized protein n=1 Tax=Zopfia rhizophila CBS 207.26 TaxID=1314779 RepID=A0A6A6DN86_9PEZI|nr:hypothetical protein K469DRAFT_715931 [Zopfia rhizophila CBS 207.26]